MEIYTFIIYFAACLTAASTGAFFGPDAWYNELSKPDWTPPNWVFPLAWSILYLMIAYAGMRIAQRDVSGVGAGLWALQLALNTLWSPLFFGKKYIRSSLVVIVLLWLSVLSCVVFFFTIDLVSFGLFLPYLLWVSFAAALNGWIYQRN